MQSTMHRSPTREERERRRERRERLRESRESAFDQDGNLRETRAELRKTRDGLRGESRSRRGSRRPRSTTTGRLGLCHDPDAPTGHQRLLGCSPTPGGATHMDPEDLAVYNAALNTAANT